MTFTHSICLLAALIAAPAAAQIPGLSKPPTPVVPAETGGANEAGKSQDPARMEFISTSYSATRSWALFAACDENSDDRIGILEATRTIGAMSIEDRSAYQRIDTDNDGYLQWSEFNEYFRSAVSAGDQFRLRLRTEPVEPFDPTQPATPESHQATLIRTKDRDRDGALSDFEFREFLLAAEMNVKPNFAEVDVDASGTVGETEMLAILPLLGDGGRTLLREYRDNPNTLPPRYDRADVDHSGTLDHDELAVSLFAIDPALQRWSATILANADLSSNGVLDRTELERAE